MINIKFILLLTIGTCISSLTISAQNILASGPMVGYSALREVMIWAQTTEPAEVYISYWQEDEPSNIYKTDPVRTEKVSSFTAHLVADMIEPGHNYEYQIWINDHLVDRPYPLKFQSQPLWQFRTDPPEFSFAAGSCLYINEAQYDRPGRPYGGNYEILNQIYQDKPDFMVWLGDNIYLREADYDSRTGIRKRYSHMRSLAELQPLMGSIHHYAIWDDHDYGPNDSDQTYWGKDLTTEAFNLFWANPNTDLTKRGGITGRFTWNDCDFFLLDNRYHRSIAGVDGKILGDEQLDWLIASLRKSRAAFKFICIGGQVLSDARVYENHAQYKNERRQLIDLLDKYNIQGVVFLGGDRHSSEVTRLETDSGNVFYDVTSSALTAGTYDHSDEPNSYRVEGSMISVNNYALLNVKGPYRGRTLHLTYKDKEGKPLFSYDLVFPAKKEEKKKK